MTRLSERTQPATSEPTTAPPDGKRRRGRRRALTWASLTLAVVVLGAAGTGWAYYRHLNSNLHKASLNLGDRRLRKPPPNAAGETPLNILLIGTDSRNSPDDLALGGSQDSVGRPGLADVEMLVHLSADRSNISVLSIPRDTRVTIPKCTDPQTGHVYRQTEDIINTSLANGGPGCTVAAWENLTGIPVDHFMMVDFSGVVSMADAIGGVPVCVDANIYSHDRLGHGSGLKLPKGTHTVTGVQALAWLRTRYGFDDNTDIARTHAQHMYLGSMMRQLRSGSKLSDPAQLMSLAEAATKALTVDPGLGSVTKLYGLADELKKVPASRTTMTTMPFDWDPRDDAHVIPNADAEKLFAMIRGDVPLDGRPASPATRPQGPGPSPTPSDTAAPKGRIAVTVENGTGTIALDPVPGRASEIAAVLAAQGFDRAAADDSLTPQADTTISYPGNDLQADAQSVAKALGLPASAVRKSTAVSGITLVVGADWRSGTTYPASRTAPATKVPDTAAALSGEDSSACMHVNPDYTW